MRFGILGAFEVTDDAGRPVDIGGHRVRALLAMLLLDAGRPVGVPRLVDGLWGDEPPAGAGNALQSVVSRLRAALEPVRPAGGRGRLVESGPAGYRLAVDPDTVDAHRFDTLTTAGRRQLTDGDPAGAAATLAEALALWRGPALADLADAPFAPAAAARLAEARLAAAEDHAEAALAAGRAADILGELTTLADQHPLRERLRGLLVRALYAAGRQADALAAYQRTQTALAEELGVDPSPELRAVQLAVLRHDPALVPPAPSERPGPVGPPQRGQNGRRAGNLRAQFTSFVGRDAEVARIGAMLADARLVTLVGPGGAGKTRLATESASRLDDPPPDGTWLVEFAPVADPADLPYAVADALGVRDTALFSGRREPVRVRTTGPVDILVRTLAGRRLLLVLDNCEHLVDAVARLVDRLLADCPGVRVLATSREPLGITGEMLFPVTPLAEPPADADPAEALAYPAVRLFADRAVAARPDFAVCDRTVGSVVRICRRLDGMPLALELAAARLRALPADQISARLDDRFSLLTAGSRTALPRHQTLRAVVEWSWDLLGERERALARRLSVFPAGAGLDAAEQVCAGPGLAAGDVLDTLAALVDKSLVEADAGPDGTPRYRMLETIRAYAAERLAAAGEDGPLRRAHARYFLELAEAADPKLRGPDQVVWMRRLAAEQENLHAALRWVVDTPDPELALRLASALAWYWTLRGHHTETMNWARQILDVIGEHPPPGQMANYVACQLGVRLDTGWLDTLPAAINAGLRRIAEAGETEPRTPLFMILRMIAAMLGGSDGALDELFDTWRSDPDPWLRAFARSARGGIGVNMGRVAGAAEDLEAGLAACRAIGDRWAVCQTLTALAELAGYAGDNARAVALLDEAEALAGELGASGEVPELVARRAIARARAGDLATARAEVAEARRRVTAGTDPHVQGFVYAAEAELARRAGDLAHADHCCTLALAGFDPNAMATGSPPQLHAVVRCTQAALALARGDRERARDLVLDALANPAMFVDHPVVAAALEALAGIALADGDAQRAAVLLGAACATRGTDDLGNPEVVAVTEAARHALGSAFTECYQRGAGLDRGGLFAVIGLPEPAADGQTLRR